MSKRTNRGRYGLKAPMSMSQVGSVMGVSKEAVRKIQNDALWRMIIRMRILYNRSPRETMRGLALLACGSGENYMPSTEERAQLQKRRKRSWREEKL